MSESPFPSQNQDKFVLRLPDGMRDRIKAAAEANSRSMNAEIVHTLEQAYPPEQEDPVDVLLQKLAEVRDGPNAQEAMLAVLEATLADWAAEFQSHEAKADDGQL